MFKRIFILTLLATGLVFVSCQTNHTGMQRADQVSVADIDVNLVQEEVDNVVGSVVTMNRETMENSEELLANESSLGKTSGYSWTGEYHMWENTVDQGAFHGVFVKKIQFKTSKDGKVVRRGGSANYMYVYASATGTWGFQDDDPWYGTTFNHFLEGEYDGFKTRDYVVTVNGQYSKINQCVYNGQDAVLEYTVKVNLEKMNMKRGNANSMQIAGKMVIDLAPWKAEVNCNGTNTAIVSVMKNGVEVANYEYDLTNLVGKGLVKF